MNETCAKCGKNLSWVERRQDPRFRAKVIPNFQGHTELLDKKFCHECIPKVAQSLVACAERKCANCAFHKVNNRVQAMGNEVWDNLILSCMKFNMEVKGKEAEQCTSFVSLVDYREKALKGEINTEPRNVQIIVDFSSLKDEMAKGGVVMTTYKCPNCNGMVDIPEDGKILVCKYCGTPIKPVDIFEKIKSLIQYSSVDRV